MIPGLVCLQLFIASAFPDNTPPRELRDFLRKADPSYHSQLRRDGASWAIDLTSQTWQGSAWNHTLLLQDIPKPSKRGLGVLFITGNGPRPGDRSILPQIAQAANLPAAMLFNIPNQPLYGSSEDELIAYTFDQYLTTHDPSWPLLFPMTKSVIRAMDAIVAATKDTANPITRFIVSGASKRGWTTWLTAAAGDDRVVAIAPMVIDNLNLGKQMRHQLEAFGKYSEQIEAYTKRGLQRKFMSPEGKHLGEIVDPYSYRSQIKVPTLIVTGSNDPYWAADACRQYWDDLKQPKWLVTVPNVGHNLGGGKQAIETFGAFCRSVAGQFSMPKEVWTVRQSGDKVSVSLKSPNAKLTKLTIWVAESATQDFRSSVYKASAVKEVSEATKVEAEIDLSQTQNTSVFAEATYKEDGYTYRLCCPTTVYPVKR